MKKTLLTHLLAVCAAVGILFAVSGAQASFRTEHPPISAEETRKYLEKDLKNSEKLLKNQDALVETQKNTQDLLNQLSLTMQQTNALLGALNISIKQSNAEQKELLETLNSSIKKQLMEQKKLNVLLGRE